MGVGFEVHHNPSESALSGFPYLIQSELSRITKDIIGAKIYFRKKGNTEYLQVGMSSVSSNIYSGEIPENFVTAPGIEYCIIFELSDGSAVAYPSDNPFSNPVQLSVKGKSVDAYNFVNDRIVPKAIILSPKPDSKINETDLLLAVSFFNEKNIDFSSIKVKLDHKYITDLVTLDKKLLTYIPKDILSGNHRIKITYNNIFGMEYQPIFWEFTVISDALTTRKEYTFNQSGKVSTDVIQALIDDEVVSIQNAYLNYRMNLDWAKIKLKVKQTSIENELLQPKNRYSFEFRTPFVNLKLGDVYPVINEYMVNGYRLRGAQINFDSNYLFVNYAQGQIARVIQGDLEDDAMVADFDTLSNLLTISRDDYTFTRDAKVASLGLKYKNRFQWNVNIFKAKDNIPSVYSSLNDAIIKLPWELTEYVDSVEYSNYFHSTEFETDDSTNIFISYNIQYSNLIKNFNEIFDDSISFDYQQLTKDWDGMSPQDNIVVGSDLSFNFDNNRAKFYTGFAFSLLNQNIWDPVVSKPGLDTLLDEFDDGYLGQTYSDIDENVFWINDSSFTVENGDTTYYSPNVDSEGIALDDIPFDPVDYEEYFHMNINQVPLLPIDISSGKIGITEIMHMPSLAYHLKLNLNYFGHSIKLGYRQIGPEFNTLGNPYLEKDIREQTFSDRVRLFHNRGLLFVKWKGTDNGVSLNDGIVGRTNRTDIGFNMYPGRGLPAFNFAVGWDTRNNGLSEIDTIYITSAIADTLDTLMTSDLRENTKTSRMNLSFSNEFNLFDISHNISCNIYKSDKVDIYEDERDLSDSTYYSPASTNRFFSANLHSVFDQSWESNLFISTSFNSFSKGPHYYDEQYLFVIDEMIYYLLPKISGKIKGGVNVSFGSGVADFVQYSIKAGAVLDLFEDFIVRADSDFRYKIVDGEDIYKNIHFTAKLSYRF